MKFYKLHLRADAGVSFGFNYFTSRHEAERTARDWMAESKEPGDCDANVVEIEVTPTKLGILAALNQHARHPDNG